MALYPTVPICVQLTDYELDSPHLGVVHVYRTVTPPPPPSLYPPLYEVEPPVTTHSLPEYVALVGLHPVKQKDLRVAPKVKKPSLQNHEESRIKMVTKEVILNRKEGKLGLRVEIEGARVLVSRVSRGWPAWTAGLRQGDQLLSVNKTQLSGLSRDKVYQVIRACPPVGIKLIFQTRNESPLFRKLECLKKSLDEL